VHEVKALQFSVSVPKFLALKTLGSVDLRPYYRGPLATVKLRDIPEPDLPTPQWVKVRTRLTGFCASDLNLLLLRESPSATPFTSFPCVLGHECRARGIEPVCPACEAGLLANCDNLAEGEMSAGMHIGLCRDTSAGFSPFFVAHQSQLFKLPEGMPFEIAVLTEPFGVGLQSVFINMPQAGEEVLLIGGGVIGCMVINAIRGLQLDCRLTVFDPSPFAAEMAKKLGADRVISDGDLLGHTVELTGARRYKPMLGQDFLMGGFARIYDTVGTSRTLNTATRCLASGGTLSLIGIHDRLKVDPTPLWLKQQTIKGLLGCGVVNYQGQRRHVFEIALELAHTGKAKLDGMVTHKFKLADYAKMIAVNLNKQRHRALKTAVSFE
jgi:threonine dehydrogenase-like Zn-dependent dehydrogenase